jgi:hypothetical protein
VSGANQLGWKHRPPEAPYCAIEFHDDDPLGLSRGKMAYSFSVCYVPSKPNTFFYVDCQTHLVADGKGNVYPVEPAQFEASCRRDAEALLAAAGFGTDGRVLPRVRASDPRGGKLVCQKGAERMEINVPPGALSGVLPIVQNAGYAESDCDFVPSE